jgi:hypothetical protein
MLATETQDLLPKREGKPIKRASPLYETRDGLQNVLEHPEAFDLRDTSRASQDAPEDRLIQQETLEAQRKIAMTIYTAMPAVAKTQFEVAIAGMLADGLDLPSIQAEYPHVPEHLILRTVARLAARVK